MLTVNTATHGSQIKNYRKLQRQPLCSIMNFIKRNDMDFFFFVIHIKFLAIFMIECGRVIEVANLAS